MLHDKIKNALDADALKALEYLEKDPLSHADMIYPIKRQTAKILYAKNDGVILLETLSDSLMISLDHHDLNAVDFAFEDYHLFAVHQAPLLDALTKDRPAQWIMDCYQMVYEGPHIDVDPHAIIKSLVLDDLSIVSSHYHAVDDDDYLIDLLNRGQIWGLYVDSFNGKNSNSLELAGFIGEHLEGSMGLLEIFPDHRRKGYGLILEKFLIDRRLKADIPAFCQVERANDKSMGLQKKCGLTCAPRGVIWFYV